MRTVSNTRLSAVYLDDLCVLSESEAWTYVKVPLTPYEFLSSETREFLAGQITLALSNLIISSQEPVDAHLRVVHRPVDAYDWAKRLSARVGPQRPTPGWNNYLVGMASHIDDLAFTEKEVYLGVMLGRRGNDSTFGFVDDLLAPLKRLVRKAEEMAQYYDYQVPEEEIVKWHAKSRDIHRTLGNGALKATPATADEVAWLIAHPLWPEMEQPIVSAATRREWGAGELRHVAESDITHHRKWLEIRQVGVRGVETGFLATLAFSRFPDVLMYPQQEPWMHVTSALPFPVEYSTRFSIVPSLKVRKDISKKLADAKDQAQHIAESGTAVPLQVREQLQVATELEYLIDKERMPWAYARHRMMIAGPTEEILVARCKNVIEDYRELGIDVSWPTGDQLDLMLESMPGDSVRGRSYYQRQDLSILGGGMPTAASDAGDKIDGSRGWQGPYLGYTTSRVASPVFFSPHVAMAKNNPPGVCITGQPGGGKSYLAFTLAYQMAVSGVWTIYIDPKADAKPMGDLPGLGQPRVFDLRDGHAGMLDPFSMGTTSSESKLLALETIRLLLGGALSEEREEALLNAVEEVAKESKPSLNRVVDTLLEHQTSRSARALGMVLNTMRDLPFARLCFSPTGGTQLRPEDGLTVVTLLGLDLPSASTKMDDYSYENRLAVSVMYLLTRYARKLMLNMDKGHPKAICIDEAWAITSTPQGAKLIPEIARMGRSHNTALVLVSQNAGDLMAESVTNSISTKFAFRSTIPNEIDDVLDLFALEKDQGYQHAIRGLRNGECVMQDVDGRVARVQVDAWNRELFNTFNTNPETRGKPDVEGGGS